MKAEELFSKTEEEQIVLAIKNAEKSTSGEIRVHIEASSKGKNTLERAVEVFQELEMHQTEARNGVLFYLAYSSRLSLSMPYKLRRYLAKELSSMVILSSRSASSS